MKLPFPPSVKATLTIVTIGRERILRSREIAQILEVVSIDTANWVQNSRDGHTVFSAVLNNLVDAFLTKKLETETDA